MTSQSVETLLTLYDEGIFGGFALNKALSGLDVSVFFFFFFFFF